MSFVVMLPEAAFTHPESGERVLVGKGHKAPEWIDEFTISALTNSGIIVQVNDDLVPVHAVVPPVVAPDVPPAQVRTPEQPPFLPSDPTGNPTSVPSPVSAEPSPRSAAVKPKAADSKTMWEDYAESVGITRSSAESLTKAELITEVGRRESTTK